ncbi:MAG: hypothetical protein N4A33_07410 [Bacteriovoracaceae bacterium]|jgi:hypothetical protein|nr:hypothetical protein [Bacteriovoracaceae bacterium]
MSGFGIRALKKVKEEESKIGKRIYFKHLVIGDDAFAVLKYLNLKSKYSDESIGLISKTMLTKKLVENFFRCQIGTIRSEACAELLVSKNPRFEILKESETPSFYKDTKFHTFGGRAKPFTLMEDEDFFTSSKYNYKWQALFESEVLENLDDHILANQHQKFIEEIELIDPTDLVEKAFYRITTSENEEFECENLYWAGSPKLFYSLVSNKDKLDDSVHSYCNQIETRTSLSVHFECKGQIYENSGTLFLPQSATHEWGHFIADIEDYDPAANIQKLTCLMFVTEDIITEEDLAKKIRLMTRTIERILPNFSKVEVTEHIHYEDDSFIKNIKDEFADSMKSSHESLNFVGLGAPISGMDDSESIKYLTRAILSL